MFTYEYVSTTVTTTAAATVVVAMPMPTIVFNGSACFQCMVSVGIFVTAGVFATLNFGVYVVVNILGIVSFV